MPAAASTTAAAAPRSRALPFPLLSQAACFFSSLSDHYRHPPRHFGGPKRQPLERASRYSIPPGPHVFMRPGAAHSPSYSRPHVWQLTYAEIACQHFRLPEAHIEENKPPVASSPLRGTAAAAAPTWRQHAADLALTIRHQAEEPAIQIPERVSSPSSAQAD